MDEDKAAKLKALQEEMERIRKEDPEDKMYEVQIVTTIKMHKMRYITYRMIEAIIGEEKHDDWYSALFGAGLDKMVKDTTKTMLGMMFGVMGGGDMKGLKDAIDDDE